MNDVFSTDEGFAVALDERDSLRDCRGLFEWPTGLGDEVVYFAGNSLGLMPKSAREAVNRELDAWADLGVEGHFDRDRAWFAYHELLRGPGERLVGASAGEVVFMNSLTVNLHLLMTSFYRPTRERFKIVIEDDAFPSDSYAVASQLRLHGIEPGDGLIRLRAREGEHAVRDEDIAALIEKEGDSIALFLLGGVNYLTGQLFDMETITRLARARGCVVGWDLAHGAGNVELRLHDWGVDFAAWCTYKYLNSFSGAVAGAFVHERHWGDGAEGLKRLEGWWGHDPSTRFKMGPMFNAARGADAWQISNPPILSMAPVLASLEIFDRVGMRAIREKSVGLTGYLERLLDEILGGRVRVMTPRDPGARGAQLSLLIETGAKEMKGALRERGVICDSREPNVIRFAPAPLYCSHHDCWRAVCALRECVDERSGAGTR